MAERPLNPEELALWRRVVATVQPAAGRTRPDSVPPVTRRAAAVVAAVPLRVAASGKPRQDPQTLDAGWDRRLAQGEVPPDRVVDLHGDTLDRAYGRIDAELAAAIAGGERVLLLITGKPGGVRTGATDPGRGAIRAVVGDWLAVSRHASRIAAVRPAHRRYGGAGALCIVLRR